MKNSLQLYLTGLLTVSATITAAGSNWPGWRGPDGTGVSSEKDLPLKWTDKENVRWHVALPGPGNSSPIVWGNRVFIAQAVQKENRRTLMCFDRENGKLLWQSGVTYAENEPTQQNNPYCAGTPVTDGERVYVCFGSAGVCAYDMDGKEAWHRDLGKLNHGFGNAVSPILHGDLCILNFGPDAKARLVALNKDTGTTAWEIEPPKVDPSEQPQMGGGFGGPGGRGGTGGRGGFGPGTMLAPSILSQADKNGDQRLTKEEFTALADAWFDKLDAGKTGKVNQERFVEKLGEMLPAPQGFGSGGGGQGGAGQRGGGGPGFGPAGFVGPGLFAAADADKDGSLTRPELKATFSKWASEWDPDKSGSLNEDKLREGLNAALPRPNFAGPGGPGGGRGRGGPGGPGGPGGFAGGPNGSWSTPIIVNASGRGELIMNFPNRLAAFDPKTGKQLWISKGLGGTIYTTPLWGEGALVGMSSGMGGGNAIALKPGGSGELTESQRLWRLDRVKSGIGSGVISGGHIYTLSQDGVAICLSLSTGQTVWEERLPSTRSQGGSWSSMVLAGDRIYVPNQAGDIFVIRAAPKFELLATNPLKGPMNSSIAVSDGELFIRTNEALWCISSKKG